MAVAAKTRKKLIEVSIPLEAINRESAREKSIRHGHPSTLHLWWARRPLAACRAVLFAQLVDDPGSCQEEFPTVKQQKAERDRLHRLIERLVPWEASNNETILNEARYEIARSVARGRGETLPPIGEMRSHQIIDYLQTNATPIYDPFSGGGSIPLEAQRLGLKAVGSDINPVAVLIGKALIEFPPKFAGRKPVNPEVNELHQWKGAQGLADDVRYYGGWMGAEAKKKIGHLYPKVKLKEGKEATVIAWLWARTVPSPDPRARGTHVPLASSFVLSAKASKEVIVKPVVDRAKMTWAFELDYSPTADALAAAKKGTKAARGANFVCLLTGAAIDDTHVKAEAMAGRMSASLMAVVAEGNRSRVYLAPTPQHVKAAVSVTPLDVPEIDQPLPNDPRNFWTVSYGLDTFAKLFTARQLVALTTFSDLVIVAREKVLADAKKHWHGAHADDARRLPDGGVGPTAYADTVTTYLGVIASKLTAYHCNVGVWRAKEQKTGRAFGRQSLPMTWDFPECNPFAGAGGDWDGACKDAAKVVAGLGSLGTGSVNRQLAQEIRVGEGAPITISTDPPYYDNVGYADLSDFYYVWLRRTLHGVHSELFRRVLTQKTEELIATPYRHGGVDNAELFFLEGMKKALANISRGVTETPATIYYAFKQSEISEDGVTSAGWATFLQAIVDNGLAVDGTWPMRTEQSAALKTKTNSLASSIVLVCRHRNASAPTVTRADLLRALRREMPEALAEIRRAGVGPTDIQQAAIGPGIGTFTRYAQVLNTDGTPMLVKDALRLVNQVREEITSTGDADYDSETRFAMDWFAAKGFDKGRSSDAITMTNAVNVSLDGVKGAGFFVAKDGDARLLKREELSDDWDPTTDRRATVWEACQHLVKRLTAEGGGIEAAAVLYNRLGALTDPVHALCRRLYDICEQKQWASEGRVYNQLHQEWEVIEMRAGELTKIGADLFSR
jgi:putative DNA methylase